MRRVVSLWLPFWPTERLRRHDAAPPADVPLVTRIHDGRRMVIGAACPAAQALGLRAGTPLAHAQAMVPGLAVMDAAPLADAQALERLAAWCLRLSPLSAADPPDGIWIDATGCAHLHGGEAPLLDRLVGQLGQQGLTGRVAVADTPGAAHALARFAASPVTVAGADATADALALLPVAALRLDTGAAAGLRRLGLDLVGQLASTPRGPLARRFGPEVLLRLDQALGRVFARHPEALARTAEIAARCTFSLAELRYQYPDESEVAGETPQQALERQVRDSIPLRYAAGLPPDVARQLRHELGLIAELGYAPYFLTVNSIVRYARSKDILCQGRGSAANSAVCFVLGITAIDPVRSGLLFERFISAERREPPDIDVDFESERREEVIQWVYERYGRDRAALCATVMRFRARGAVRDVGKVMGLTEDVTGSLAAQVWGWSDEGVAEAHAAELNLNLGDRRLRLTLALARTLIGFPRQLGTHPGGFVLTHDRLDDLVPIEPASMVDRQVIEWDKDDIDALRFMKVDVLGLGMLGCMRRCFELLERHHGTRLDVASIPAEDPATYAMIRRADTLGTFQIESRAQMAMLPRLKPATFYDLAVQVAIVRPGPIQGDMVHPYLRRREGLEPAHYPKPELERVLGKTLGVPLF